MSIAACGAFLVQAVPKSHPYDPGGLSDRNPANFLKDNVRMPTMNSVFPDEFVQAGNTARQDTTMGGCFVFLPLPQGQTTAFIESALDSA